MTFTNPFMMLFAAVLLTALTACGDSRSVQTQESQQEIDRKLQLQIGNRTVSAVLYDNPPTGALLAQLPLMLTLTDYNGTEKIGNPPEKLTVTWAPDGFSQKAGDIACYEPWGNLVIFYRDFRYSQNLILLGKIEGDGIEALR